MENAVYIYGLLDPRDNRCRYVGKTDDPERRTKEHLGAKDFSHRTCWLRNLAAEGLEPQLKVLEECPVSTWQARERWWIASLQTVGADLTNGSKGGLGGSKKGHVTSPEGRARITEAVRKARIGTRHTSEAKAKMSAAKKGKKPSARLLEAARRNAIRGREVIAETHAMSYPALINMRTGQIVSAGRNRNRLCRELNLNATNFSRLLNGSYQQCNGWTIYVEHSDVKE